MRLSQYPHPSTTVKALVVILALFLTGLVPLPQGAGPEALASHDSGVAVETQWELLSEVLEGVAKTKIIPVERGSLPGGTTGFDPLPTVTLEVFGRHVGGSGQARYEVQLHSPNGVLATVPFSASDSTYQIKSAAFAWPSATTALPRLKLEKITVGLDLAGTLDVRKAYLRIRQAGTVKKIVHRIPVAVKQPSITSTAWQDVADPVVYRHMSGEFDPAPVITLRSTGREKTQGAQVQASLHVRLVDSSGQEVVGSENTHSSNGSKISLPLALTNDETYRLQVRVDQNIPPEDGELSSADLVFEQSTTDALGIIRTLSPFAGVTSPTEILQHNVDLGFPFSAPSLTAPEVTPLWWASVQRTVGSGDVGVALARRGSTDAAFATAVTTSAVYVDSGSSVPALPPPGSVLDTRSTLETGSQGRVSSSLYLAGLALRDLELEATAAALGLTLEQAGKARDLTPAVADLASSAESTYPDTFAGIWRDYSIGGGRVQLAFTSDPVGKVAALAPTFPDPTFIDPVLATFSKAELVPLSNQISADVDSWLAQGVRINSVGVDVKRNRVAVGIVTGDTAARDQLEAHYGITSVVYDEGSEFNDIEDQDPGCERTQCAAKQLRAGLEVIIPEGTTLYTCTLAFTSSHGASNGFRGILTAGHCGPRSGALDRRALHGGVPLGAGSYQLNSGKVDAMWIDLSDTWSPSANWVWEEVFSKKYTITSKMGSSGGSVGDPICHSGKRRGYRCGQITNPSASVRVPSGTFTDMVQDDVCTGPGDSGGPAYYNHKAHGILKASNALISADRSSYRCREQSIDGEGPKTWYTKIYNIEQAFPVIVQTWPRSCFNGQVACPPGTP